MAKPVLVSGIQPTGKLHLGNYLGALKNFVTLQNSDNYRCFFFIADLHALTENPDPRELRKNITDLALDFLAAGLDPKNSTLFLQSEIPAHQEMAWIFSTFTPVSELMRMTAFKEKIFQRIKRDVGKRASEKEIQKIMGESNFGLAEYPILMAADILLYDAQFVPIGEDQLQHLELARTLARKFNKKFGKTFTEPQPILTTIPRLMSLDDPAKKMSKSLPAGCLFIDDDPQTVKNKIKRAVTDSGTNIKYDPKKKPALSNLISIYSALTTWNAKTVELRFKNMNYGEFKEKLAELVIRHFEPFRKKKRELSGKIDTVVSAIGRGSRSANEIASQKILEVKRRVGLL